VIRNFKVRASSPGRAISSRDLEIMVCSEYVPKVGTSDTLPHGGAEVPPGGRDNARPSSGVDFLPLVTC